jgi:hypothetical protein
MFNRSRFRQRFDGSVVAGLTEGTLVAPYFFAAPLALSRAQTGGVQSSAVGADELSLTFYGADTPRFTGAAQNLLIEGQGTNVVGNSACEGAVAGSPGTYPTGWFVNGNGLGLNWNVVGAGNENNIPYVDLRLSGTSSGSGFSGVAPAPFAGVAAPGQAWTGSCYIRTMSGTLSGISSIDLYNIEYDLGVAFLRQAFVNANVGAASLLQSRTNISTVMGASTALVDSRIYVFNTAASVDVTLRVAGPQLKQLPLADTPSFPPAGTSAASTRGADLVSASLASLGIPASGACTILWSGVIPTFISGATHTIACVDDASVNNRFTMRVDQATGQLQAMRSLAGADTTAAAGAVTAGVPFKAGMAINGAGRAAVSLNGGAVAAVTGGPSSSLTQSRLGNISNATAPMWGETLRFQVLTSVLSDADLQTATGALP